MSCSEHISLSVCTHFHRLLPKGQTSTKAKRNNLSRIFRVFLFVYFACSYPSVNALNTNLTAYRLLGGKSFAQYSPWQTCSNGTLKLEFKTHEPNGLLLYAQNLPYRYIQLAVTEGLVHIRFRISDNDDPRGIFLVHDTNVNDDKWHELEIRRNSERTIFKIDESTYTHTHLDSTHSDDSDGGFLGEFDQTTENSNLLYVGGLSDTLQTYDLSLSTALFEQPFNGFIRNVRMLNCTANMHRARLIDSHGLRYMKHMNYCTSNACLNNGICLNMDNGYACDCSFTSHIGRNCETCKFLDFFTAIEVQMEFRFFQILFSLYRAKMANKNLKKSFFSVQTTQTLLFLILVFLIQSSKN
jgi:hypothetical protein